MSMDVFEAIERRVSDRSFEPRKVPRELVADLLEAARWAPSSCNLQLAEYIVVDDDEILGVLAAEVTRKFTWGSTFIVFIYDPRADSWSSGTPMPIMGSSA